MNLIPRTAAAICCSLTAICSLMAGCISHHTETVAHVDSRAWSAGQQVSVTLENGDSLSMRNIDILLRFGRDLNTDTLSLNVTVLTPDSVSFTETIAVPVAFEHDGGSRFMEISAPYRKNAVLSKTGSYIFTFSHNGGTISGTSTDTSTDTSAGEITGKIIGISAIGVKTTPVRQNR